ncbi:restriction endonuclease subunit S [Nodosilinea sp. LEGE 06152]|uniref:restriction endonuclease subunit S n=1 Tax=Nodosilinea sp. LEGE 06152 TaxID=2777966 RepID=UPI00187F99D2|nr:restriction endonuclease subunit S [Nodosilinea sp. LEGE 06152]MBE9160368.1 restriction endonuclease subunit S [Nodosilinea sp. LEGE 06152]
MCQSRQGSSLDSATPEYKIPLPPIAEQRRIAAILDKADAIRRKRKQAIQYTEELLRATFLDMFGDPVTNPKGWKVVNIGDITGVKTGKTPSREVPENYGGKVRWVKTTEVKDRVIYETEEHLTEKGASQMKIFPKDSILIAMYGQGATRGRTALLGCDCTTNQACAVILPNAYSYSSVYLWSLLMFSYERLRDLGRGGNQPNLNLNMVKSFEICLPPIDLQNKFKNIFTMLNSQKSKLNKASYENDSLFNSLLQRAFRGEL